jgi:predicted outer membrane repeat protein
LKSGILLRSETGVADCVTIDAQQQTNVFHGSYRSEVTIEGFTITGGLDDYGGGIKCSGATAMLLKNCVFHNNSAGQGGAIYGAYEAAIEIDSCTIAYNWCTNNGAGVYFSGSFTAANTIFAFNSGADVIECGFSEQVQVTCCDLYGNPGGQWTGPVAGLEGIDGNFTADPVFCNGIEADLSLAAISPCLEVAGCGRIGALGEGCAGPADHQTWLIPIDAPTIQAGIDIAAAGDTVMVTCGTYTWSSEGTGNSEGLIRLKSDVVLCSETGLPDCVTLDAQSQGRVIYGIDLSVFTSITGFTLTGGDVAGMPSNDGGGIYLESSPITVSSCRFVSNSADMGGGVSSSLATPVFSECEFRANTATLLGGAVYSNGFAENLQPGPTFEYCTFFENTSGFLGSCGYYYWTGGRYDHCLMYDNGNLNEPVYYLNYGTVLFENTIIAFNRGEVVSTNLMPAYSCCDVYGNGIDTQGPGSINSDPMFCDPENGDFSLNRESPCLIGACGQIGPYGQGDCGWQITSVADINPDQGGQVRVTWVPSFHDDPDTDLSILSYGLWRRIDDRANGEIDQSEVIELMPNRDAPAGAWDCVMTVPAWGQESYSVVSPTLCDSTETDGINWSVFFVTAHTADPFVYAITLPDSGYSVDNIVPTPPSNFRFETVDQIAWDASSAPDVNYYSVYGSATGEFVDADLLTQTIDLSLDITVYEFSWYFVSAIDFSGNESLPTALGNPAAASENELLPRTCALYAVKPNPFRGSTNISFELPQAALVRLLVIDVNGRIAATVLDQQVDAGHQEINWLARGSETPALTPGIYFLKLAVDGRTIGSERMIVMK